MYLNVFGHDETLFHKERAAWENVKEKHAKTPISFRKIVNLQRELKNLTALIAVFCPVSHS